MIEVRKDLGTRVENNLTTETFLIQEHSDVTEAVGSSSQHMVMVDEIPLLNQVQV